MVYFLASLAGAVGAFAGWLTSGGIIAFFAATFGVAPDAASMYFAVLGPVGALLGLAIGCAAILRFKAGIRTPSELVRRGAYMVLMIGLIAGGGLQLGGQAISHLGITPKASAAAFEIRLPQLVMSRGAVAPTAANSQ